MLIGVQSDVRSLRSLLLILLRGVKTKRGVYYACVNPASQISLGRWGVRSRDKEQDFKIASWIYRLHPATHTFLPTYPGSIVASEER